MEGQKRRTQILLEPEQHEALVAIADQEKRSISAIVHEIIGQHLEQRTREAKKQRAIGALETLTQLRKRIKQRYGMVQDDLLIEIGEESDAQIR